MERAIAIKCPYTLCIDYLYIRTEFTLLTTSPPLCASALNTSTFLSVLRELRGYPEPKLSNQQSRPLGYGLRLQRVGREKNA